MRLPARADTGLFSGENGGGDIAAGLLVQLLATLNAGLHAHDAGDIRQPQFTWKAALTAQPVHLMHDTDAALFDPAVPLIVIDVGVDAASLSDVKAGLDLSLQRRLVGFHR